MVPLVLYQALISCLIGLAMAKTLVKKRLNLNHMAKEKKKKPQLGVALDIFDFRAMGAKNVDDIRSYILT